MNVDQRTRPTALSPVVAHWLRLQARPRVRWALRFGLRWVFAVVLLACLGLTVGYYKVFRHAGALAGPTLRLAANDSVGPGQDGDAPLAGAQLRDFLDRALLRYRIACGEEPDKIEIASSYDWSNPYGPPVTVVADRDATHGALDALLHTCVDAGFERFVLRDAADPDRSFSFVLFPDRPREGLPDWCGLPPLKLTLWAAEDGSLAGLKINAKRLPDFAALRRCLNGIIGPNRGPTSIHDSVELEMDCQPYLKLRHVLAACETVSGYRNKDGEWVSLVPRARPVLWGSGWAEIDCSEFDEVLEE